MLLKRTKIDIKIIASILELVDCLTTKKNKNFFYIRNPLFYKGFGFFLSLIYIINEKKIWWIKKFL